MSDQRQKNQLVLAFTEKGRSEAPKASQEGTESSPYPDARHNGSYLRAREIGRCGVIEERLDLQCLRRNDG
jgi:hypothetical protein